MTQLPYIVAEMGASHCGSLARALKIIDAAKEAGADAIKLQTWSEMTVCAEPIKSGPWAGRTLVDLYRDCRLPWDWHATIFEHARSLDLGCFSTPFDDESVAFLETLECPVYKIASFEVTHLTLIRRAAATGKPIIISTGMANEQEIENAIDAATTSGAGGITLLKCVSAYPAPVEDFNVITMAHMVERFGCQAGLSDHTRGSAVAIAATALGAAVIEKHVSIDRDGPDGGFVSTPDEFAAFVRDVRAASAAVGGVRYGPLEAEADSLQFRRSLWVTRDVKAGEEFTRENVAILRPQGGLPPDHLDAVIGTRAKRDATRGEPVTSDLVS